MPFPKLIDEDGQEIPIKGFGAARPNKNTDVIKLRQSAPGATSTSSPVKGLGNPRLFNKRPIQEGNPDKKQSQLPQRIRRINDSQGPGIVNETLEVIKNIPASKVDQNISIPESTVKGVEVPKLQDPDFDPIAIPATSAIHEIDTDDILASTSTIIEPAIISKIDDISQSNMTADKISSSNQIENPLYQKNDHIRVNLVGDTPVIHEADAKNFETLPEDTQVLVSMSLQDVAALKEIGKNVNREGNNQGFIQKSGSIRETIEQILKIKKDSLSNSQLANTLSNIARSENSARLDAQLDSLSKTSEIIDKVNQNSNNDSQSIEFAEIDIATNKTDDQEQNLIPDELNQDAVAIEDPEHNEEAINNSENFTDDSNRVPIIEPDAPLKISSQILAGVERYHTEQENVRTSKSNSSTETIIPEVVDQTNTITQSNEITDQNSIQIESKTQAVQIQEAATQDTIKNNSSSIGDQFIEEQTIASQVELDQPAQVVSQPEKNDPLAQASKDHQELASTLHVEPAAPVNQNLSVEVPHLTAPALSVEEIDRSNLGVQPLMPLVPSEDEITDFGADTLARIENDKSLATKNVDNEADKQKPGIMYLPDFIFLNGPQIRHEVLIAREEKEIEPVVKVLIEEKIPDYVNHQEPAVSLIRSQHTPVNNSAIIYDKVDHTINVAPKFGKEVSINDQLVQACFLSQLKTVSFLLEQGADPTIRGTVINAAGKEIPDMTPIRAALLATTQDDVTPKMLKKQTARIVKLLLSRGAITDDHEREIVMHCARHNLAEVLEVLGQHNVRLRRYGFEVMGLSMYLGHTDVMKSMTLYNCSVNIQNDRGNRPFLDLCSQSFRIGEISFTSKEQSIETLAETFRSYVDVGLNLEATDKVGCTALMRSIATGNHNFTKALLMAGANPRAMLKTGVSATHLACICMNSTQLKSFLDMSGTHNELSALKTTMLKPDVAEAVRQANLINN